MRRLFGSWIFIVVMLAIDFYVFQSLKIVTASLPARSKFWVHAAYWSFTVVALLLFLIIPTIGFNALPVFVRTYLFAIIMGFFIAKMVAALFFAVDDLRRLFQWGGQTTMALANGKGISAGESIPRSTFLSWLGIGIGAGLFSTLLYGFSNKYNFCIQQVKLRLKSLPNSFKNMKIIHISDIHAGSLEDKNAVKKGIEKLMGLEPDLIFFTGDLVNNTADEMDGWVEVFSQVKAPMGVYSVLGNHDYGDYHPWPDAAAKKANLDRLKSVHQNLGWNLLLNEHRVIERNGESLALIGVENWGAKANFSRYGDLKKAYSGSEPHPFKILLSHDPSHWDAQVCADYGDIDLMLSGHTHGMQFGVEIPGIRWSPVQYVYKQWAGLYQKGRQHLYINRGFGFLGYPGRVGILPEITFIEFS